MRAEGVRKTGISGVTLRLLDDIQCVQSESRDSNMSIYEDISRRESFITHLLKVIYNHSPSK